MNTKKRRRSEGADPETEVQRPCRITYHVDERVFDRVFHEDSLDEMREVIRKKLRLPDAELELTQLRDEMEVDLEDEDDFASLQAQALVDSRIDVLVTVLDAPADWSFSRAATPAPEPSFERGRSVEPAAAPRRRSGSFGMQSRLSIPAVTNLLRAKNLLPGGAAVFDDDDDDEEQEREEPTLGERVNQAKKRLSTGAQDVARIAGNVAVIARDKGEKALAGVESAGKKAAAAAKSTAKAVTDNSIVQDTTEVVASAAKSTAKAAKTSAALAQELGEKTADAASGMVKAAKRTIQATDDEPPPKKRKKKHSSGDADVSMTDAVPAPAPTASNDGPPREKKAPKKKKLEPSSVERPASSTTKDPTPADLSNAKPKKRKKSILDPSLPSKPVAAPVDLSSLDPVTRGILARVAEREKEQAELENQKVKRKAARTAKTAEEKESKESKKKRKKDAERADTGETAVEISGAEVADEREMDGTTKKSQPAASEKDAGVEDAPAASEVKPKKKPERPPKARPEAAIEPPTMNGTEPEPDNGKTKRAKKDALQVQDDPEMPSVAPVEKPSSKEKRRRLICEVVIEVPAKKSKKGEQLNANRTPQAKKNIPAAGLGSEDRVADEEEKRKAVAIEDTLDNEDTPPTNITNTPRASAFLDRLVQASTPARRSPRRSPVNSLGFPAQLQRTHSASSGTPSTSTPRRFQDALAQAVTTPPAASQEEITEYSQPLPPTSSSLRKILNSPIARTPSGKTLRPLSKLPRPSLTKTPGMQTTSPSPTGPPVPSPKKTIAPNIRAPTARQPTISPSLGRASLTPRASPLPTWTPLPQDSSPNPSGVDHGPSQVDQLRSSSTGLVEEISRPNSAVTRDEEMEVERATQEDRYDDEDDNDAPLDAELEDITTDERTRADEDGSDREDDVLPAIETPKLSVLGPPAQITGTGDDLIGPDAIAAYSLLDLSNAHVSSKSLSPKRASPRADNHSGKSSQLSKGPSDSSLVSYPSIPTPKPASQPLFRPDTQMPSQFQPLRMQDEETSIFSMASQYVGLSALSKDKLRESMSRAASSSQAKSTAAATNRNSAKRKEPESETEEEEEDDDDSDLEESILPRDRMAGANKARRGRAAAKFF